jgi:hypothetical protein
LCGVNGFGATLYKRRGWPGWRRFGAAFGEHKVDGALAAFATNAISGVLWHSKFPFNPSESSSIPNSEWYFHCRLSQALCEAGNSYRDRRFLRFGGLGKSAKT